MREGDDIVPAHQETPDSVDVVALYAEHHETLLEFNPRLALYGVLSSLLPVVETARKEYLGLPDKDNSRSLSEFLREVRQLCTAIYAMAGKDRREAHEKLVGSAIKPFISELLDANAQELAAAVSSISKRTGIDQSVLRDELIVAVSRFPAALLTAYETLVRKSAELLDVPDERIDILLDSMKGAIPSSDEAERMFRRKVSR